MVYGGACGTTDTELDEQVLEYIEGIENKKRGEKPRSSSPRIVDTEHNKLVEEGAIKATRRHYESKKYKVESVESENLGWDLEAVRGDEKLLIEVKGTGAEEINVDLTPNEYEKFQTKGDYVLCIITQARSDQPNFHAFEKGEDGEWRDAESGKCLVIVERTMAKITAKSS